MYAQVNLATSSIVGTPGAVPANLQGLTDAALANLSVALSPVPAGLSGQGFWPVTLVTPPFDATAQIPDGTYAYAANSSTKTVTGTANLRALTTQELAANQTALVTYANEKQWLIVTSGYTVTIGGVPYMFPTDSESQGLITGKAVRLGQANPPSTVRWQFGPTSFTVFQASDFLNAACKIADFVQATFDALSNTVLPAIAAGTIKTNAEVDGAAWPVNMG